MRGFIIRMIVRVLRWVVLNLLLSPLVKKYLEIPLYGFLMKITGGVVPEEDLERGGGAGGVSAVDDSAGAGDSPV